LANIGIEGDLSFERCRGLRKELRNGMIQKFDHIGIAVHSIASARLFYEKVLCLTCEKIEEVASQKVRVAFFALGDTHIELLEPLTDKSPIARFLDKYGEGVHHLAYHTDDIEQQLNLARQAGLTLINETPVLGAGGKKVAFVHPESAGGVLTEFCQPG
jgi:methylmalonyl-CoA/ethylmalonyl-CoA epimerase